ncbi:MAG: hypothetical protein IKO55_09880 [Kiritimatiellae bacterium]|nr:hypothetical protein [Kiritimatiellia bacterium]
MNNYEEEKKQQLGRYRPNLCFYHANAKGTGSAVKMNLHPAHDNTDGSIMLTIANQLTIGDRTAQKPTFATFDWDNAICVKLDFGDLSLVLQVLRGMQESINDGKGLYHRSHRGATVIRLTHRIEPSPGYILEVCRKPFDAGEAEGRACFTFSASEALGVCEALTGAMCFVCFGIPMLVPHDTSAYKAGIRGFAASA